MDTKIKFRFIVRYYTQLNESLVLCAQGVSSSEQEKEVLTTHDSELPVMVAEDTLSIIICRKV